MKLIATIAVALVTTTTSVAGASAGASPDAFERAVNRHLAATPNYLERADAHYRRLQARLEGRNELDPAIATAIAAHQSTPSLADRRSPDAIDAGQRAHAADLHGGRSPDTSDASLRPQTAVEQVVAASGFDWGDFAIGAGSMLGLLALVGVPALTIHGKRSRRTRLSPA
jgi:hypothetical protein